MLFADVIIAFVPSPFPFGAVKYVCVLMQLIHQGDTALNIWLTLMTKTKGMDWAHYHGQYLEAQINPLDAAYSFFCSAVCAFTSVL